VNWQHFRTFLWLRWRLRLNQLKRAGTINAIILAVMACAVAFFAVVLVVALFLVGLFVLPQASPLVLLYVWDGLIVAFLFFWAVGLLTDLQRSEILSLDKLLHLPVSPAGAFLINYLSSLVSLNTVLFVPAMLALIVALAIGRGAALLMLVPLLAAFLLMVTAVTYQFQGWLAALMVNPRRRRTVLVVVTVVFILVCQVPNLVNLAQPWKRQQSDDLAARLHDKQEELERARAAGKLSAAQYQQELKQAQSAHQAHLRELSDQSWSQAGQTAVLVNVLFPPGWLALGAMTLSEGAIAVPALAILGQALIGAASLWRSYRTTVRFYRGEFTSGTKAVSSAVTPAAAPGSPGMLEKRVPGLSEHVSAIAVAGLRGLLRAPEAKMMLLGPIILVVIFGSMIGTGSLQMPAPLRPLLIYGAMAMVLLSMGQVVGNQFGFDRNGFRVFVLCPARRRDILVGKNMAVAPLALALGAVLAVLIQVIYPVRFDHFLAALPQFVSMYLLFCLLANLLSILAPMPIAAGAFRPTNPKGIPLLLHMGFTFLFPLALAPTLFPLAIELACAPWLAGVPLCLILSLLECAAVVRLYRLLLEWEGRLLQLREQRILEIVTAKAE
jgi:ABC-2 type transport system permease protein